MSYELNYHFKPQKGWMNDPNGLTYFDGYYHVFFQHAPHFEIPWKEPMVWGHARTKDFLKWEELPIALNADEEYDKGGVWSGTAVVYENTLYLYYASVQDGKQMISVAYSQDGIHFRKYENNPIIREFPKDGSKDFRDPAILIDGGDKYLVVASANTENQAGNLLLYKGKDMFTWEYQGVIMSYPGTRFCECPSFVKSGDHYILSTSVVRMDDSHYFEVLYGTFDGKRFSPEIVSHFQKGPDEYAGQIFNDPDGRSILISWIPGWKYAGYKEKNLGCLSLPLEITVHDQKLCGYPVKEVRHLLSNNELTDHYIRESFVRNGEEVYVNLLI